MIDICHLYWRFIHSICTDFAQPRNEGPDMFWTRNQVEWSGQRASIFQIVDPEPRSREFPLHVSVILVKWISHVSLLQIINTPLIKAFIIEFYLFIIKPCVNLIYLDPVLYTLNW